MDAQQSKQTPQQECKPGITARASAAAAATAAALTMVWQKMTKDGTLAAAGRQGVDEIGQALKAFPDAIQAQETGTIFSPTQGEIAASRSPQMLYGKAASPQQPTLKEMLRDDAPAIREQDRGSVHGHDQKQTGNIHHPTLNEMLREDASKPQDRGGVHGEHGKGGTVLEQREKSFVEEEMERRQKAKQEGNSEDQNERAKGRSLPEEQQEREKERERDRGRDR